MIGTTMRDIQIIIINCSNNAPTVNNCLSLSNVTGAVVTDCNSLGVCPGQNVSFTISGYDADAQAVTVTSNIATSIPGATLTTTQVGGPDSVVVVFSWTPSGIDTGFRYFTVQFEDNACPITGLQLFTYDITVLDGIDAGPDKYYCPGGGPVQVNVYGGNHFSWSQTTGMVSANPDSSVVLFAPTTNTTYYVTSDLLGGCKNRDTVTVFNVMPFGISFTSPDDTICLNSSTTITVNPTPLNQGPFTYQWGPTNLGVLDPTSQTTEVRPGNTTQYQVTVTSAAGCAIKDSFQVVIQGIGPKVSVYPSANYVCPGSPVNLTATVSALECGLNPDPLNPCLPNSTFALQDIGTATTNAGANTTPYIGLWDDGRVQYLFRASELQAMGLTAGTITDIGFNVATKASTQPYNEFTVKMGCTSLSQLPTSYVTAGLSTVVNPQSYSSVAGWNTHTLDAPYNWDGFSNLIIEVCFNNSSYSGYDNVYFTTTAFTGSVLFDNADLTTQSGCTALNTPTLGQDRPNTRFIMCKAPLNNYSFTWTGSDGSTLPDTSEVSVPVFHNVDYTLVVDDGTCQGDSTISLFVDTAVLISAGNDTTICSSTGAQLNAVVLNPATTYCTPTYALTSIPYSVIAPVGATTAGPVGDDAVSSGITIPFGFDFFCASKTQMFISTNGFLSFSAGQGSGCCAGQAIPNATSANDLVALCWEDLNTNSGGTIDYFVSGTAPNRVMVVRWNNVAFYSVGGFVNGQIQLYETSNIIEIHINGATTAGQTNTLGIENSSGTVAYSPLGYNAAAWTVNAGAPVAFRFTPQFAGNSLTGVQWTPSLGLSNDTILNPIANPLSNTTYVVDATFFNGCVTHDTVTVSLGTFPYTLSATPDTICPGDSSQLLFTGNGVAYNWTPAQFLSSSTINNPLASPFSTTAFYLSATNATGCVINDSVIVNVRSHSPITLGNDQTVCPYDSVVLSPSGAPYVSYNWSTTAVTPTITTANQTAITQDYYVIVSDGTCLFSSDTVTISERVLNPIVVQPSGDTAVCVGESIVLSADPGYSNYIWSNGANTQVVTITQAGQYSYTATDNNGCILQSLDTANVIAAQHPVADILVSDDNICEDQTTAVLSVSPVTGIVYTWNPGFIISDSIVVSTAGIYTLVASDNGCNSFDTVVISSTQAPVVDLGANQNLCACDTQVVLSTTILGTYIWSNSATSPSISVSSTGTYSLTVTDSNNCTANDNVDVTIRCLTVDAFVADPPTATVFQGNNATLSSTTSYSSNFGYLWTPATYLDDSTKSQPYVQSPQTTTTYQVFVTDLVNGCTASDTVRLAVVPPGVPPMPNAFSPNGDGANDVYGPYIPSALQGVYTIVNMRIYNRWGQLVYNNNGYWDGTFAGSLQPADTYIYYITIQGPDQNNAGAIVQYNLTGSFTLLH
ncbi:MAG: gliding motility-associated C-terminal domain-containing protein [Chitinophagales bacterium]